MPKHLFVVFTNAVDGLESEFNQWYSDTHLPDLLNVPGVGAAQRFSLSHTQMPDTLQPFKYMAIYELETDNIQGVVDELNARLGSPDLVMSDALAPKVDAYFYAPITTRRTLAPS
ncbi:MAG: hypothetical protein JWO83_2466 [Caulobacteraceae bacterium]|jgi:hypothetical protein|nr:hypothetical protein [Caulobacteraceae bacterium]